MSFPTITVKYWDSIGKDARTHLSLFALTFLLLLSACTPVEQGKMEGSMDHDSMEGMESMEMENSSDAMRVAIIPAPEGPNGEYLTIELTDMEGSPITDAMVSLEGNMNHAGMVPVTTDGVADDADGEVDGRYQVPFEFNMSGDWIVTISAMMADGTMEMQDVMVSVNSEKVEVHQ